MSKPPPYLFRAVPAAEAAAFLLEKPAISRAVFDELLPDLQARAFMVTEIEAADVLQSLKETLAKLPAGGDWKTIRTELAAQISPWLSSPEAAAKRAELLLRHHGLAAYQVAQGRQIEEHADVFPYLQYVATRDGRVRDGHDALNGIILPVDDPFWLDHMPPWEWNCRCQVIQVSRARYAQIAERDAARPPEERQILDEPTRERMNREKVLTRTRGLGTGTEPGERPGIPTRVDLRTARDRAGTSGPATTKDLRMPLDTIRERYDADVWAHFEARAKARRLDDGRTLWDWANESALAQPERNQIPTP